jgi:hypothetical protein
LQGGLYYETPNDQNLLLKALQKYLLFLQKLFTSVEKFCLPKKKKKKKNDNY